MRRERTEIIAQILMFCMRPRPKTHIMYNNNLSHAQLQSYLNLLSSQGLLAHNSSEYVTTEKGHRLISAFASLNDVLNGGGADFSKEIVTETYEEFEIIRIESE